MKKGVAVKKEVVMVCGSRNFPNKKMVQDWANRLTRDIILIHGGCLQSPDIWAGGIAQRAGIVVGVFPFVEGFGGGGGPIRNQAMVDMADRVVCFWDNYSKGTGGVVSYATRLNKKLEVYTP